MHIFILVPLLLTATPVDSINVPIMAPVNYSNATVHVSKGRAGKDEAVIAQVLIEENPENVATCLWK